MEVGIDKWVSHRSVAWVIKLCAERALLIGTWSEDIMVNKCSFATLGGLPPTSPSP